MPALVLDDGRVLPESEVICEYLEDAWVYADVYEYELPWIAVGQQSIVEVSYLPGQSFRGSVTYVYPFLDPKTRSARVRIELPNPDLILKPEMNGNVTIETEVHPGVLAIPEEAVIRSGRRSIAIVALEAGRFEPREVTLASFRRRSRSSSARARTRGEARLLRVLIG